MRPTCHIIIRHSAAQEWPTISETERQGILPRTIAGTNSLGCAAATMEKARAEKWKGETCERMQRCWNERVASREETQRDRTKFEVRRGFATKDCPEIVGIFKARRGKNRGCVKGSARLGESGESRPE